MGILLSLFSGVLARGKLIGYAVILLAFATLAGFTWHYRSEYNSTKAQELVWVQKYGELNQLYTQTASNLTAANSSIAQISAESQKKLAQAQVETEKAQALAKKYQEKATNLLTAQPTSSNVCQSAENLMHSYLLSLKAPQ